MSYKNLLVDKQNGITIMTMNRPERLNAFDWATRVEFRKALEEEDKDETTRVVILTGAGRGFCAGLDIRAAEGNTAREEEQLRARMLHPGLSPFQNETCTSALRNLAKPTICALNGVMAGLGFGLALSCDIIIASEKASFLVGFGQLGLTLEYDTWYLLPRRVGVHRALELYYTNDRIDAREMERIGLVNRVVPHDELMNKAKEMAKKILRIPPVSLAFTKRGAWLADACALESQNLHEPMVYHLLRQVEDKVEASRAFKEKRVPIYKGKLPR